MCLSEGGPLPPCLKLFPLYNGHPTTTTPLELQVHGDMDSGFCFTSSSVTDWSSVMGSTGCFGEHKTRQEHGLYPQERRCHFWLVDPLVFAAILDAGYFYSHNVPEKGAKLLLFPFVG